MYAMNNDQQPHNTKSLDFEFEPAISLIDTDSFDKQGYHMIWSAGQSHEDGFGFDFNSKSKILYKEHLTVSNKIILLKLKSQKMHINLIQVYTPTIHSNENAIQEFYEDFNAATKKFESGEMMLIMSD